MYTYEQCLAETMTAIKEYQRLRKDKNEWDYWRFQEIRDVLSEAMLNFIPYYADIRAAAEQAEIDRKIYYEERKEYWKEEYKGQRGYASLIESKALQDCKEIYAAEVKANREHYKARYLYERVDQMLNSIAGRCKGLLKDWEE